MFKSLRTFCRKKRGNPGPIFKWILQYTCRISLLLLNKKQNVFVFFTKIRRSTVLGTVYVIIGLHMICIYAQPTRTGHSGHTHTQRKRPLACRGSTNRNRLVRGTPNGVRVRVPSLPIDSPENRWTPRTIISINNDACNTYEYIA